MQSIEDNIRRALRDRGLTQDDCARSLGVTQPGINKMLHRKDAIRYGTLLKVAAFLGMDVVDVIRYSPDGGGGCAMCREKDAVIRNLNCYIKRLEESGNGSKNKNI